MYPSSITGLTMLFHNVPFSHLCPPTGPRMLQEQGTLSFPLYNLVTLTWPVHRNHVGELLRNPDSRAPPPI